MKFVALFFICCLLSLFFPEIDAVNYCSKSLCPAGRKHVACGPKYKKFFARCPSNARMVNLKKFRNVIVKEHNKKRQLVASGRLKGYKPARRMATMQWDPQLAYLASLNVKQCKVEHDSCRNTPKFPKSGQNIGMVGYTGSLSVRTIVRDLIGSFFREYKNANMRIINSYPKRYSGPDIGHFTVMMTEKSNRIGCAASMWNDGSSNNLLFVCNYASTNVAGEPIYRKGKQASGCRRGRNPAFKSLCNRREIYPR